MPESTQNDGLFVGRGATITGNVALAGKLTIDGQIDGEISAKEIHVGEAGKISGWIQVRGATKMNPVTGG